MLFTHRNVPQIYCLFTMALGEAIKSRRYWKQFLDFLPFLKLATQAISIFARIHLQEAWGFPSFVRELWRDLFTLLAVAGDLDFSEDKTAHNWLPGSSKVRSVLQDSVAGPEKSCQKAFLSGLQLSHSRAGFAVTPSWLTSAWLLCLHNCSLHGCCTGWLSSLYVVRAFMYAS